MMSMIHFEASLEQLLQKDMIQRDLPVPLLVERALERHEGILTDAGAFRATTGHYTGRSPRDRFIVDESSTHADIDWGKVNQPVSPDVFSRLYDKVISFLNSRDEIFVRQGYAGADPHYRLPVRIVTELAWHNLFARQLFLRPDHQEPEHMQPAFTAISAPSFKADPKVDGTNSEAFIMISFERKTILIGGTEYAGEMKKAIFSVMNYLLPKENVLSMHCSANVGREGDTALFFGLSGTGKTTLSADPERMLIGDDEHAWSHNGIFNLEGGCYAKTIHLTEQKEPDIYRAIRFGSVLENVYVDSNTRKPDYDRCDYTENTRAAYPIDNISHCQPSGMAGHPHTILFLTADASGVLPPISKLSPSQAMYHFLSGYTSKLAGTERGITEPEPTFSTCFGAPFLPLEASVYAEMLGSKMLEHDTDVYLVNTGWTGGAFGTGERMALPYTRAMVRAALNGDFNNTRFDQDPVFGLAIPEQCPGVPDELLQPRSTWKDPSAYDGEANALAGAFKANFKKFNTMPSFIKEGGPR